MDLKLKEVEQVVNSELTSKIKKTSIIFDELVIPSEINWTMYIPLDILAVELLVGLQ